MRGFFVSGLAISRAQFRNNCASGFSVRFLSLRAWTAWRVVGRSTGRATARAGVPVDYSGHRLDRAECPLVTQFRHRARHVAAPHDIVPSASTVVVRWRSV